MSKLIVEMEMPKNCPCELSAEVFDPFGNYGGHQPCFAWYGIPARSKEFDRCVVRSERPSWCPIKGVLHDEHGDLIDRDALKKEISVLQDTSIIPWVKAREYAEIAKSSTLNIIDDQHAVIEAERKDDEQIH